MKTPFIWLGSGRTRKWAVSEKVRLLDQAAGAGLPVPPGAVLLDEFLHWVIAEGVVVEGKNTPAGSFSTPDPVWLAEALYNGIHFPQPDNPVAVYAAFSKTEGDLPVDHRLLADESPQEQARPHFLEVDFADPVQLAESLCRVWSSALPEVQRKDILIMEMIQTEIGGGALIRKAELIDEVTAATKTAVSPTTHRLPQLRAWQRPQADLPAYFQRLQKLLRGVRRTFGKGDWQIEWADDDRICWLLQVKPLPWQQS